MNIATGECASEEVMNALKSIESVSQNQYKNFVKKVIKDKTVSIHDTIKKNSLPLFKRQKPKPKTKSKQQVYTQKPALPTISLRVWKGKIRGEVRPRDKCNCLPVRSSRIYLHSTIVRSLMEQLLFTSFHPPLFPPFIAMLKPSLSYSF